MERNTKIAIWIFGIILVLTLFTVFGLAVFNPGLLSEFTGYNTPVFCNDYEFTCCNEVEDFRTTQTVTDERFFECSATASKCVITSHSTTYSGASWYTGSSGCKMESFLWDDYFTCENERRGFKSTLSAGEIIWIQMPNSRYSDISGRISVTVYEDRLDFCGKSGCGVGVPVWGADGCTFHPANDKVYTTTGSLKSGQVSYTVPSGSCVLAFQSGDRHICGYLEETCSSDGDCGGHTYGNQECYGRKLQTYGCRTFGKTVAEERDRLPGDFGWGSSSSEVLGGSRCEIIKAENVQCCGDNDCGTEFFCDTSTFTCEKEVECTHDYDCGVSVICDYTSLQLKNPICIFGECSHAKKNVDCCIDRNCPSGYFCDSNYKCEKSIVPKRVCPYECCVNEELYFDRLCPEGETCSEDNTCTKTVPGQDKFNLNWLYIFPVLITIGMATLFGYRGKKKTGEYSVMDFVIGFIFGGIIGIIVYWIFSNWLILLILSSLGVVGTIILISVLGGVPFLIYLTMLMMDR